MYRRRTTVLSLLVVPCMYTYSDDLQAVIVRMWRWRPFRRGGELAEAPSQAHPEGHRQRRGQPRLEQVGSRS